MLFHKKDDGTIEYLLLKYLADHWDFPKGHVEKGESYADTISRELREETGIKEIRLIPGFVRVIEYEFRRGGQKIPKQVTFYLAETPVKEVKLSMEHKDFRWLPYEKAFASLTFENAKDILRDAHRLLTRKG